MPKVSFVVDSDAWGGAEVYTRHLLRRAGRLGWSASLVCSEAVAAGFTDVLPPNRMQVVGLARHSEHAPQIESALRSQRPDVVQLNLVDPASNTAAMIASSHVAATVGTLHLIGDTGRGSRRAELAGLYGRLAAVLSPSDEGRDQLVEELAVLPARVGVVPNGVEIPAKPTGPAGHHPPRIGAVGRLTGQKGFDVLLQAVRELHDCGLALDLVIAGTGRDGASLSEQAHGLSVEFRGFVDDVPRLLGDLDVFCLPSRSEALPFALLEAMAAGLPCVTTDVGQVRSAVGRGAMVVPPQDVRALAAALTALLRDSDLRADLGRRAHARAVSHLGVDVMATKTFDFIRRNALPSTTVEQP